MKYPKPLRPEKEPEPPREIIRLIKRRRTGGKGGRGGKGRKPCQHPNLGEALNEDKKIFLCQHCETEIGD